MMKTVELISANEQCFEIAADDRTVWINADSGMCVGRFTKNGMDVHEDALAQMEGKHCLDCAMHLKGDIVKSWERFTASMKKYYHIDIPADFKPHYVK